MTVYVDSAFHPYGRMIMCHMFADTREELTTMAEAIGVNPKWIQKRGTVYEHFDISKGRRDSLPSSKVPLQSQEKRLVAEKLQVQFSENMDHEAVLFEYYKMKGMKSFISAHRGTTW